MTSNPGSGECSLVLFPIRKRRFALPSSAIRELAPPVRLHKFPHSSRTIVGVIVRRGQIIPVYDAGALLAGRPSTLHRFYLIAQCSPEEDAELAAIPVDGECELAIGAVETHTDPAAYISGAARIGGESIPIVDLAALVAAPSLEPNEQIQVESRS